MTGVASSLRAMPRLGSLSGNFVLPAVVLVGLLALSLVLRTNSLGESLWMDEGLSIGIASQPLFDIPGVLRVDGSPPLYYMMLAVWMDLFGDGPAETQALSVAIALLAIPGGMWAGLEPVRPARRPHLRGALRGQPLPHGLRAGDPHVRAHAGALAGRHRGLPARVRLRAAALPAAVHGAAGGHALHPQLGAVPGRGPLLCAGAVLVRVRGPVELREGRADRLRRRRDPLPAVGADAAPPDPAHRRPLAESSELRRAGADLQEPARRRYADGCAGARRRLGHRRHPPAPRARTRSAPR